MGFVNKNLKKIILIIENFDSQINKTISNFSSISIYIIQKAIIY